MTTFDQLSVAECALRAKLRPRAWCTYVYRGQAPPPNGHLGRSPWWTEGRLKAWLDYGPGRTGVDWAEWARNNPDV